MATRESRRHGATRSIRFQPSEGGEAKNKTVILRTQNNANNSWYCGGSTTSNNNKTNGNTAIPFFAHPLAATVLEYAYIMTEYITIEEVDAGYRDCCRRKRGTEGCVEYSQNYLLNNLQLYKELNDMTYEIGQSRAFIVTRPKLREVFCAQFRDRVVHHILALKFLPLLESEMPDCAYACRKGKGTDYGINDIRQKIEKISDNYTKETWIVKGDLRSFFMSIDRSLLYSILERTIRSRYSNNDIEWWLWLWHKVILNSPEKNCVRVGDLSLWNRLPKSKSLFTSDGKGMPIGNLPSQMLANLLMSSFDKWVMERIGFGYGRYVDDFVMIGNDKRLLLGTYHDARTYLRDNLKLTLHPDKVYIQEASKGVMMTGAVIKPGRIYVGNGTVKHLFDVINKWNIQSDLDWEHTEYYVKRVNSLFGHLINRNSYAIRRTAWRAISHKSDVYCINMRKIKQFKRK